MPRAALSTPQHAPLTGAQRQRRHREKRRRELAALRAVTPSTQSEKDLLQQVQRLTAQLEKATRDAAALRTRVEVLEAEQGTAQALRDALPAMLDKLTPASRQVARKCLEGAGLAPKHVPPTATPAQHVPSGAYLIF